MEELIPTYRIVEFMKMWINSKYEAYTVMSDLG